MNLVKQQMKLNKNKKIIFALVVTVMLIIPVVLSILSNNNSANAEQPIANLPTDVQGPQLVVPESPLGIIGVFTAIISAFALYTFIAKNKHTS